MSTLPRAVGPLTLLRKIETDTVAEIFQGTLDTLEGRPVLVRRMLPHVLRDSTRLRAIESRARDLMKIDDDRLLRTFHWVVEGTERYLVEDMAAGIGLDSLITWCRFAERPLEPDVFLAIAYRICDALDALHAHRGADDQPLLHMGMSPSSITLQPGGRVTLGLYALTRAPGAVPVDVPSSTLNYRSQYLSPEQTHPDRPLEPSSDVFAAGTILYELLMLEPLSSGTNSVETVHTIRRGEHGAQLAAAAGRVPAIDAVLARALAIDPAARYRDAAAVCDDIRILLGGDTGDVEALDQFLEPLLAGIAEGARRNTIVPSPFDDPERTAGEALVTWSTEQAKEDDDTLVRERPGDPSFYSREFARAVDPTDAPDLFDEPTGEIVVDPSTVTDAGDAADTQFYRVPSELPPVEAAPEPRPVAPSPSLPPPSGEPPPLWTEESSQWTEESSERSPLRIAAWIGAVAAVVVFAAIVLGATKMLTGPKPAPPAPVETAVAPKPPPPVVAPAPEEAPPIEPPVVEPREPAVARPPVPPREPPVVADVEPPTIPADRTPPRAPVEPPPAIEEPEAPLPHETEPSPIPDEDLFADLSTSRKPSVDDLLPIVTDLAPVDNEPIAYTRIDIDGMKPSARNGELTSADVLALEGVTANDPAYTRSRALLLMNAQKAKDQKAVKRYLDDLMRLPENQYDPIFLTELARYYVGVGKYLQAVDKAKTAEQHWARLPSDLVYAKKAEMYEIQARGYTGIFFESESFEALDQAIRCWEKYRAHVATRSNDELVAMADKELTKLRTYRERME